MARPLHSYLRFFLHKALPGAFRHNLYLLPYSVYIRRFMKKVDIDHMPLFSYIEIETINRCNGKCAFCPVNALERQRPYAKMEDDLYRKIINQLYELKYSGELHLFSNNEPFLDPRIIEFAKYAREKVPKAYITIYTNGSLLTLDKVKDISQYLDLMVVDNYTEDGAISDTLKEIKEYFEKNERYAEKVQFDDRDPQEVLSSRGGQAPNKKTTTLFGVKRGCIYPYRQMVIRPDGKCSLCCNDALGKYTMGDANTESLRDIWYGERYRKIRKRMKKYGRDKLPLCKECDTHFFDKT